MGYSQIDGPLAGLLPLVGVYGTGFATVAVAGALALFATRSRAAVVRGAAGIAVIAVAAIAGGQAGFTQATGAPVTVALLQGNVPQELKFVPGRFEATLKTYTALAEGTQAKLIVFPETAIPRFLHQVDPVYIERLAAIAKRNGGDALVGVPLRREEGYYNAVLTLGTSAQQGYAKSHLVPFGEFVPPGFKWVVNVLQIPLSDFARGAADAKPLAIAGERVAPNICYEDAFGEEIIRQLPEATLLVNVSQRRVVRRFAARRRSTCASRGCARSRPAATCCAPPTPASPRSSTTAAGWPRACRRSPRACSKARRRAARAPRPMSSSATAACWRWWCWRCSPRC